MKRDRLSRATRILGAIVGGSFLILGAVELAIRLDEPLPLFFWLPTLWGGAVLVLVGVFRATGRTAVVLVILGALLGSAPSVWTVLLPILAVTLVILTIVQMDRQTPVPVGPNV